jgi:transmembrane sensor
LEDGSRLQINGGSTLSVKMERGRRLVHMDQAEAVFDVAHDAGRPFLIDVGESQVRVVGTAFNIRRSAQETEVSVLRGVVEVGDLDRSGRKVRLTVGQAVRRADADDRMTVAPVDVRTAAAWTQGRRAYDDRPLSEIAADLSRAFATPVTVAPDAANLRFSGVLVLDDEAAVIGRLERFLPIKATRGPQGVRLERR